jgi:hypothetical protein
MASKKPEKAKIIVTGKSKETIEVMFNPGEYSIDKSNNFTWDHVQGTTSPTGHFNSGGSTTLNVELFFDTYEKGTDVRTHTKKIANLLEKSKGGDAPPVCQFVWGTLLFKGIVEKVSQSFTMFLESGVPVRAKVKVTFRSWTTPGEQQAATQSASAQTKQKTMKQGDQLWQVASAEYKDPSQWRSIAKANNINNPARPPAGRNITVPGRKR